jgi:hypothetical protein
VTITPSLAFDVAWEVYQAIRGDQNGMAIMDPTKVPSDGAWRPDAGPRASEYIADFSLCCVRALEGPEWASRFILCRLYYLGLAPYENARHFLGLREDIWVNWTEQIRERVGKEVLHRGLFPVRQYFGERSKRRMVPQPKSRGKVNLGGGLRTEA